MKPAHCWKDLGPRPLTSLSCSLFINGPFFSRHSIIFLALLAFSPAMCLREKFTEYIYYHWTFINTSAIYYKDIRYCRKSVLQNLKTVKIFANRLKDIILKRIPSLSSMEGIHSNQQKLVWQYSSAHTWLVSQGHIIYDLLAISVMPTQLVMSYGLLPAALFRKQRGRSIQDR